MSFKEIGTSFLTGFLTQKGKQMTAANEKAERYYDLQLQLAEQNKGKYKSRVAVANNLVSVANEIRSLYGTEEQIKAAVAQGPKELSNLLSRMKRDKDLKGAGWNKDYVQGVYAKLPANVTNSPEWLKYSEMDTTDYIMETLGVKKYEVGDYKSPDSSFWDKLSGKNRMARTRADLDELEFYEGMSVYDINQSANEADYNALLPGAFLEYTTDKYITSDVITTFRDNAAKVLKDINQNDTYKNILEVAKKSFEDLPTGPTFEQMVTSKSTNQAGKTIVNLSSLIKGDRITYEKNAVEGVTEEEFNKWADEDIEISNYIRISNEYSQAKGRMEELIRPDIEGLISVAEKDYGSNFTKDTEISRIIKKYVPSYQTGAVDDTTDADAGGVAGGAEVSAAGAEVSAAGAEVSAAKTLSEQNVKNLRVVKPNNDKLWDYTGPKGKKFRIISPNSDNPMIIPYFPTGGKLDFKNRQQGDAARKMLDESGLTGNFTVETIMLTEKQKRKKENLKIQGYNVDQDAGGIIAALGEKPTREELITKKRAEESEKALSIATSNEAEDFYTIYKGSDVENLSDNELIAAFGSSYKGRLSFNSGFKSVLAEAIRKNIIAKQKLGDK